MSQECIDLFAVFDDVNLDMNRSWQYAVSGARHVWGWQRRLGTGTWDTSKVGQALTTPAGSQYTLTEIEMLLWSLLHKGITGELYVRVYEVTGTVGTNATPTGDPIATSNVYQIEELPNDAGIRSGWGISPEVRFQFSGDDQITLEPEHDYAFCVEIASGNPNRYMLVRASKESFASDRGFTPHAGNGFYYWKSAWYASANEDTHFAIYGIEQ